MSSPMPSSSAGKRHRHRRSGAISGDFDAMGLGLIQLPSSRRPSIPDFDLDKHFHFNNLEDFSEKAKTMEFEFPNSVPTASALTSLPSPRGLHSKLASPSRPSLHHQSVHSLNSPIRLDRKSHSVHLAPKTSFFLTEETRVNSENVPDAVIDLDEVLSANLHIGDNLSTSSLTQPLLRQGHGYSKSDETMIAPFNMYPDEPEAQPILSSPFMKLSPSPFISSPLSLSHNPLFYQPIQEQYRETLNDVILEENQLEGHGCESSDPVHHAYNDDIIRQQTVVTEQLPKSFPHPARPAEVMPASASTSDLEGELYPNPQSALVGLYANDSANSSSSSLKSSTIRNISNPLIEKTFSNDSTGNYNANLGFINQCHTPSSSSNKRSGAKATRYQSFYDQSFKISNALKVSSTESVNIIRTTSNESSSTSQDIRILGHSSSLPSLKTVQIPNHKLKFNEIRIQNLTNPISANSNYNNSTAAIRKLSPPVQGKPKTSSQAMHQISSSNTPPKIVKNISNSPISINSEVSSTLISSNATIQSTEYSSLHENQAGSFTSKGSEQNTMTEGTQTPLIVISADHLERAKHTPTATPANANAPGTFSVEKSVEGSKATNDGLNVAVKTPEISTSSASSTISGSTSSATPISPKYPEGVSSDQVSISKSLPNSRRPLSPQEKEFLILTRIPTYKPALNSPAHEASSNLSGVANSNVSIHPPKKPTYKTQGHPKATNHSRLAASHRVLHDNHFRHLVGPVRSLEHGTDDASSLKLNTSKRNSRLFNWLKRR